MVKYNDANYIEYRVNFANGEYSKNQVYTLDPSMLYDAPSEPSSTPSTPSYTPSSQPAHSDAGSIVSTVAPAQ